MTMKKVLFILFNLITIAGMAQTKGRFEVHDMGSFKLHVYHTNDALGDASYIIEGKEALVTMEQPLFRDNVAEFDAYLSELGKPVEKRITDYHAGGTGSHDVVMAQGMPAFMKGETYGGMMEGFAQALGDALAAMPTGKATEVAFGTTHTWAGATFGFRRGGASDFPGASILIGARHITPTGPRQGRMPAICRFHQRRPSTPKPRRLKTPWRQGRSCSSAGMAARWGAARWSSGSLT